MQKVEKELTEIFLQKKSDLSGFTLVEMLIVVALILVLAFYALPKVSTFLRFSMTSATREIASTLKRAYNSAVITGQVHRVVYDLDREQFWVEVGPPGALLESEASKKKFEENRSLFDAKPQASGFSVAESVTDKKLTMPTGVAFQDIISEQEEEPITEGIAYTHIFPHGVTERTVIHLVDTEANNLSLVVRALLGKTRLLEGYVSKEEAYAQ